MLLQYNPTTLANFLIVKSSEPFSKLELMPSWCCPITRIHFTRDISRDSRYVAIQASRSHREPIQHLSPWFLALSLTTAGVFRNLCKRQPPALCHYFDSLLLLAWALKNKNSRLVRSRVWWRTIHWRGIWILKLFVPGWCRPVHATWSSPPATLCMAVCLPLGLLEFLGLY